MALRSLQKWHGAGNDFIVDVIEQGTASWWTPQRAKDICDRQTGIGADGRLLAEGGCEGSMVL
jgi:diaminopimelate epimerase